ncbi:MAG: HEAT repeat domain-containing protein [Polyangiaceae bacterium]|nr:HEAT repeat domain-containing protein [Myxococcales bacterium]MCB9586372.1 HEAT repeat domain-containing protein [Polyangiaceae bacterium]MCB9607048.1 HEAT repeat domain-containing protein [Polyangiaceae bacterium]
MRSRLTRLAAVAGLGLLLWARPEPAGAFVWPNTAERVEQDLEKPELALRRRAATRLLELPDAVGRRLTLKALKDEDNEVRLLAAQAALELEPKGAGELVAGWLNDAEKRVRLVACEVLAISPSKNAIMPLGRVLGDPDPGVRVAAARALGASAEKDAVMPLLGHLDDKHPDVREAVIEALTELGDARAVAPIIGKIQDSRGPVRIAAAGALGRFGDKRAVSALILALRDTEREVRIKALESLGALKAQDATLAIVEALLDQQDVRVAAVNALSRVGGERALDALMDQLAQSADQRSVIQALARMGDAATAKLVQCLTGQTNRTLTNGCAAALVESKGAKSDQVIVDALRRGVVDARVGMLGLAELKSPLGLPVVLAFLSDDEPVVRRAAIDAAGKLLDPGKPDGRAVGPIREALQAARDHKHERRALVALLGRTGSARAAQVLLPLARKSDDLGLRVAAIESLGMLGPAKADSVLIDALRDEHGSVRLASAVALSRVASGKSASKLLEQFDKGAEQDRGALALALGGALEHTKDARVLERAFSTLARTRGAERDALLEALGRNTLPNTTQRLVKLTRGAAAVDRAKLAEVLSRHPKARQALLELAKDPDAAVRANAVWSLGGVAESGDAGAVWKAVADSDPAVAANATAAYARLAKRTKSDAKPKLCGVLSDARAYVRANALAGLRLLGQRCPGEPERALLRDDASDVVRSKAANLLYDVQPSAEDRRALVLCESSDPSSQVAVACEEAAEPIPSTEEPVTVFVVPLGQTKPAARAPFTLIRADGLLRTGLSDRRGAVHEFAAPRGYIELGVPVALVK